MFRAALHRARHRAPASPADRGTPTSSDPRPAQTQRRRALCRHINISDGHVVHLLTTTETTWHSLHVSCHFSSLPRADASTANGRLCTDMWPKGTGPSSLPTVDPKEPWKLLPVQFEELCERVFLTDVHTPHPKVMITHPTLADDLRRFEISLRLQGIVQNVNIAPLGNWTG